MLEQVGLGEKHLMDYRPVFGEEVIARIEELA